MDILLHYSTNSVDIQIDGWSCGESHTFFWASQITITTIILYYFREKGRGRDMELELEYWGFFYIKPRVEGETAWRSGQTFSSSILLYHCISVAIFHCS